MGDATFHILGVPGSLRRHSYNLGLLRAAQDNAPPGVSIQIFDISDIPLYNADVEAVGFPEPVTRFKESILSADALLFATPEYNYSVPGVLKNAIDWASRPPTPSVLDRKPVAIMGASPSHFGTVRAQLALRQILASNGSYVLPMPELHVYNAAQRFDAESVLQDENTKRRIRALVEALVGWARRLESP